jgi:hypothetical protein
MFVKCISFEGQLTTDYPQVYSAHVGLHPHTAAADTQWNAVWHRVCTHSRRVTAPVSFPFGTVVQAGFQRVRRGNSVVPGCRLRGQFWLGNLVFSSLFEAGELSKLPGLWFGGCIIFAQFTYCNCYRQFCRTVNLNSIRMSNSIAHFSSITVDQVHHELASKPGILFERDGNGRTPLLIASFAKNWAAATVLVENGADVTVQDKFGASALIFSCMMGQFDFAKLLVSRGADLSAKNMVAVGYAVVCVINIDVICV